MKNKVIIDILEKLIYEIGFDTDWYSDYFTHIKDVLKELREEEMDRIVDERVKKFGLDKII